MVPFLGADGVAGAGVVPLEAGGEGGFEAGAGAFVELVWAGVDGPKKAPVTCAVTLLMVPVTPLVMALVMESTEPAPSSGQPK